MSFSQAAGIGATGVGAAAALAPFFIDRPDFNNPASAAMPYLKDVPGAMAPYYNPYITAGQGAMGNLQNQYGEMINDPGALNAKIASGYQQSPGYQFALKQALLASNNAAAAGGMAGSPQNQQQNMSVATGLASQDFNNYMNRVLGIYSGGIAGEQGLNEMGYGAATNMGTNVGNSLLSEANLAYQGTGQQNAYNQAEAKANADMWGGLAGMAGNVLQALPFLG